MTAEEYLKDVFEIEDQSVIVEAMESYARLMIEKDRERVEDIVMQYTMTLPPERREAMSRVIVDWPIILT